jgi:hypothetical protein
MLWLCQQRVSQGEYIVASESVSESDKMTHAFVFSYM